MNYSFLDHNKPLPRYFRQIGFALVFICIAAGLFLKISSAETIYDFTTRGIRNTFFGALVIIFLSKSKIEDERSEELKLQITKLGYSMMLFFFIIIELSCTEEKPLGNYSMLFFYFSSILSLQVILFTALQYGQVIDLVTEKKDLYQFAALIILFSIFFFNKWIWSI